MTTESLKVKQEALHAIIEKVALENGLSNDNLEPIYDGVADIEGYLASNPKIMWILKEPYDDKDSEGSPVGGGWSLTEHFRNKEDVWKDLPMWQVMIQVNHSIRKKISNWEELPYIENEPEMRHELERIAYINLSKMPAYTASGNLSGSYDIWKKTLLKQIEVYEPEIIIFGYTFNYFREDLGITDSPVAWTESDDCWPSSVYEKDGKLFVDAYHPARKGGEDGARSYVSGIVEPLLKAMAK